MSTHASIAVVLENGSIASVYCHSDGYVDHVGKVLDAHYNTYEKAVELVSKGDISSLSESDEFVTGHSFETPIDGYTVFYGRDRGETGVEMHITKGYNGVEGNYAMALRRYDAKYNYLFKYGKWHVYIGDDKYSTAYDELIPIKGGE